MPFKYRKIIVVVGKTGYGKSYAVKTEIVPGLPRVVILDIMNEYNRENDFDDSAYIVFYDVETYREYMIQHLESETLHVICRFSNNVEYEYAMSIAHIAEDTAIVIEEVHNFASPHYYTPELEAIIRFGRHSSTWLICVSQRVSDIGPLLLNNADLLVTFQLTDKNDINRLASISYVNDPESVARLERRQFIAHENT